MNKLILVFDYFKEAFHLNKQNKSLYKPQIALIAIDALIILFLGISLYRWIGLENLLTFREMRSDEILSLLLSQGFKLLVIGLIYALISVLIEAGLLNMYKKAVTQGHTVPGDFKEGLSKYFLKLLLGNLLLLLCFIPALPIYLLLGVVTLTVGLAVIPIIAGVFLTMWKVSLVMNDYGIIAAAKDSFRFAKRNFIPLTLLQLIHWAFAQGVSQGGSSNFNIPDVNSFSQGFGQGLDQNFNNEFFNLPGAAEGIETFIHILKIFMAVLIPVITIASILASLIAMVFEVFFSLALFVAYKNNFEVEENPLPITEELADASLVEESNIKVDNEEVNNREVEQ